MRITQKISSFESTSWLSLCWSYHVWELSFMFPLMLYKTKWCIKRDVRYTVMILSVIYRFMCDTVPGAHIRFMHSILSLKWSVTPTVCQTHYARRSTLSLSPPGSRRSCSGHLTRLCSEFFILHNSEPVPLPRLKLHPLLDKSLFLELHALPDGGSMIFALSSITSLPHQQNA
jgi:hypothetical protein